MSEPPDKKPDAPGSADRTDTPSVRSVALGAATTLGGVGMLAAFIIGGPLVLAGVAVCAIGGTVAVARVRNPRAGKTRQGAIAALLSRPRRPGKTTAGAGKLPWPLTGNQSKRASGKPSTGRTGIGNKARGVAARLPALTPKGRAKRAAANRTGAHGVQPRSAGAPRAQVRPGAKPGTHAARTPRAGVAPRPGAAAGRSKPTTAPGKPAAPSARNRHRTPGRTVPRLGASTRPGGRPGTGGGKVATAIKRPTATGRAGVRPSTSARPVRRTGDGVKRTGRLHPADPRSPKIGTRSRRTSSPSPRVTRSRPGTGSARTPQRTTLPRRTGGAATARARRLATPLTPVRRRDHRIPKVPQVNRTAARLQPRVKTPTRRLVRTAMRVPQRQGWRVTRPTKVQQRKARRHLTSRGKVLARRAAYGTLKSPITAARWGYRNRPLALWPTAPKMPDPRWSIPTVTAKPKTDPRRVRPAPPEPPAPRRHRTPKPVLTGRRAPAGATGTATASKGTATMSSHPAEALAEVAMLIANYQPQSAREFEDFLRQQEDAVKVLGAAYRTLGQRAGADMPFGPAVADVIADLGAGFVGLEKVAGNLAPTLRAAHPEKWGAIESPAPQQGLWNPELNG